MKKLITAVLAGAMAVSMAVPSFAASYTLTPGGYCRTTSASGIISANAKLDKLTVSAQVYNLRNKLIASPTKTQSGTARVQNPRSYSEQLSCIKVTGSGEMNGAVVPCYEVKTIPAS